MEMQLGYTSLSALSARWHVDPATARSALTQAQIMACPVHVAPRYAWSEILEHIERWPMDSLSAIDLTLPLYRTEHLADQLNVTAQTIRNYGRKGRLHEIRLSPRTLRYALPFTRLAESEAKTADPRKR